jgi:orotate phosphoribosyltransferase
VLSFPYVRDFIKSEMCNVIFEKFEGADMLAGVATAGIPWGAMAADQLKLPYIYVRPKPKDHGLGNQIEGAFATTNKILVIETIIVKEIKPADGKYDEKIIADRIDYRVVNLYLLSV